MEATDRLRRAGLASEMAVVLAGGATACAATPSGPDGTPHGAALAAAGPGQPVQVTIVRAGQAHTVPVTLGTLPAG